MKLESNLDIQTQDKFGLTEYNCHVWVCSFIVCNYHGWVLFNYI